MNKKTLIAALTLITLCTAGTAFAQVSAQADASVEARAGGLGKGINSMVRGILGDTESSQARYSAPTAEPSLMMQMDAVDANMRSAPEAATMSFKASDAADTIIPMSDTELSAYVHDLLITDGNIQSIETSDTHVRITYAVPSRVFGLVRVSMRVTASATISGQSDVAYPWYAGLTSATRAVVRSRMAQSVEPLIPEHPFAPDEQRVLIDEIYHTLSAELGASTARDR